MCTKLHINEETRVTIEVIEGYGHVIVYTRHKPEVLVVADIWELQPGNDHIVVSLLQIRLLHLLFS